MSLLKGQFVGYDTLNKLWQLGTFWLLFGNFSGFQVTDCWLPESMVGSFNKVLSWVYTKCRQMATLNFFKLSQLSRKFFVVNKEKAVRYVTKKNHQNLRTDPFKIFSVPSLFFQFSPFLLLISGFTVWNSLLLFDIPRSDIDVFSLLNETFLYRENMLNTATTMMTKKRRKKYYFNEEMSCRKKAAEKIGNISLIKTSWYRSEVVIAEGANSFRFPRLAFEWHLTWV